MGPPKEPRGLSQGGKCHIDQRSKAEKKKATQIDLFKGPRCRFSLYFGLFCPLPGP
jgi:hypothetical protein